MKGIKFDGESTPQYAPPQDSSRMTQFLVQCGVKDHATANRILVGFIIVAFIVVSFIIIAKPTPADEKPPSPKDFMSTTR